MAAPPMSARPAGSRRRPRRRTVLLTLGGLLLVVLAWAVWAVVEVHTIAVELTAADADQADVRTALSARDFDAAARSVDDLAGHAATARTSAGRLPLVIASALPYVGDDVQAVRTVTTSLDVVTTDVLRPLVATAATLDPGSLVSDGRVDVTAVGAEAATARSAADAAETQRVLVADIDTSGLLRPVHGPVNRVQGAVAEVARTTELLAELSAELPEMLGADGPRQYVVAVQNLAEARPTGGLFGAWALLRMDDGRPTLVDTGTDDDLTTLSSPAALPPEIRELYGDDVRLTQNVNLSPDFPVAAELLSQTWVEQGREAPDGVVAIDPVVLQQIMTATGPVTVGGGPQLTSANVVDWLMRDVYDSLGGDSDVRRGYLGDVTEDVFGQLSASPPALAGAVEAVATSRARSHLRVWSADSDEQAFLVRAGVSGALPAADDSRVGVYVTNADGSKLDFWLATDVTVSCTSDGPVVDVRLTNGAPETVPTYMGNQIGVTGTDLQDLAPGARSDKTTHRVVVALFLSPDRGVAGYDVDGAAGGFAVGTESGWTAVRTTVDLVRDRPSDLRFQLSGSDVVPESVDTQPMLNEVTTDVADAVRC